MYPTTFERLKTPLITVGLIAGYGLSNYLSIHVLLDVKAGPAFWAASAFLIAGMLMLRGAARIACVAGCLFISGAFSYLASPHLTMSAISVVLTGALCALLAFLTRKICRTPQVRNLKQAMKLLGLVILPVCLLTAAILAYMMHPTLGAPFITAAIQWFMACFMGSAMVLPTLLLLMTPPRNRTPRRSGLERGLLIAAVILMMAAAWTPYYLLSLALAFPFATLLAMRLGGRATAISILLITLTGFVYPFVYPAPAPGATEASVNAVIFGFQIYIVVVFYNGLLTAMVMDHGARIKRQMERRTAIVRAARARAQKASLAKTEFLAAMSHELRTPLNGVLGFTQILLQRKSLPKDMRRSLELIEKSGDALLVIVNDVLDYSRAESGRIELRPAPVLVSALARDAVDIIADEADSKGLTVTASTEGEAGRRCNLDEARIRQILLNLLDNAVKFTDAGSVELKVILTESTARFDVIDTGVGIAADQLNGLFEGFSQVDASVTRAYGGAGLGLAICKSLVGLMGGRMGVESRPNEGSRFWFEIPLEAAADLTVPQVAATEHTAHVLVVDDHPVNRELAVTLLGLLGCTSDEVENGAEAVEAMKASRYDAVLMDVHMPVMDGITATRAIRAMGGAVGATPIIGLSADVMIETVERCMAAGMDEHLGKPVNIVKLQASMAACLDVAAQPDTKVA